MDEGTKKKYEGMHKDLKEKYEEEYKEWFEDGGEEEALRKIRRKLVVVVEALRRRKAKSPPVCQLEEVVPTSRVRSLLRTVSLLPRLAVAEVIKRRVLRTKVIKTANM